jgi:hypothetical protein
LSSLPPELDVPLPLRLGVIELPVVGEVPGVAELAAGSPVVEPLPLGTPFCAFAGAMANISVAARAIAMGFMTIPFGWSDNLPRGSPFRFGTGRDPVRTGIGICRGRELSTKNEISGIFCMIDS